jgi:hypothetical protein
MQSLLEVGESRKDSGGVRVPKGLNMNNRG